MELVRHETCQQYFRRRLREGWKCISLEGYNAVLVSPDGVRRELNLKNDVLTLRPSASGDITDITSQHPDSTAHWDKVDEAEADDGDTYVYTEYTNYQYDLYNLPSHGAVSGIINSVRIYFRFHSNTGAAPVYAKSVHKSGGITDYGTEYTTQTVWVTRSELYTTNPATGDPYTWAEIDALQVGVGLKGSTYYTPDAECTQVYVVVDYTPVVAPTVTTQAASSVEATTARLNGTIVDTGGENCYERGFAYWDPTVKYVWDDGSFGTGPFNKVPSGLSPGTEIPYRAYASNSAGTGWGDIVYFTTKPAPPTSVAATDGVYTDRVRITWVKSTGATQYQVYRNGVALGWLGDVATFDDFGAGAPSITKGTVTASDGSYTNRVYLNASGYGTNNGATHTYKVKARNATGESGYSGTNTGYRKPGTLSRQWQKSAADSPASYSNISGATSDPYNYYGAPAPTITPGNAAASDGLYATYVALSLSGQSANVGAGRYYRARYTAAGCPTQYTSGNRGYRGVGSLTYQWQRSAGDSDANYSNISGATTASYDDTGAPKTGGRYYRCVENATGATQQISSSDRGYRVGETTYDTMVGNPTSWVWGKCDYEVSEECPVGSEANWTWKVPTLAGPDKTPQGLPTSFSWGSE